MAKKSDDRKDVVILGGGGYGITLAGDLTKKLDSSKYNLTLVSARPYYIHLVAAIRFTVTDEGKLEDRAFIPLDKLFASGNGTVVQGKVTAIEEVGEGKGGELLLETGEKIHYDTLILATGSNWPGPVGFPDSDNDIRSFLDSARSKYAAAKEIVFIGGGALGIETAGEVRDSFPDKKVTIVHGDDQLLNNTYPAKFRKTITQKVLARGVHLVLNDYIDNIPAEGTVGLTTRNGHSIPGADLVIPTFGPRPNTSIISSLGSDVLTERGHVKVNPTLEVTGHPGIFAMGDIIEWKEQKQLGKAPGHVGVVSANVLSYLAGKPLAKVYKSPPEMIVIPIGRNGGGSYLDILWGIQLGDWITSFAKGQGLFISMYRKMLGYTD
ncbi:hypothetical protein BXZ70DRAFT_670573 [Cristinia sonorae]|uniref:FAD/NAD(P)-binding domain-containing protein n=1 Tax=Cristinia sonorae TaxID=1940300 RepID=A0A8K0UTL7_9AGAR|nr:hypothetical protein BXZ70DRAFT_670573 [Cristinia sonorae]